MQDIPPSGSTTLAVAIDQPQLALLNQMRISGETRMRVHVRLGDEMITFNSVSVLGMHTIDWPYSLALTLRYQSFSRHTGASPAEGDAAAAQQIYRQIQSDSQKQMAERQKIQADLQEKMFKITQDVTVNKQRTANRAAATMDQYIRN